MESIYDGLNPLEYGMQDLQGCWEGVSKAEWEGKTY